MRQGEDNQATVFCMAETFIARIQEQRRVAIPKIIFGLLKLREGDSVRISVEKAKA